MENERLRVLYVFGGERAQGAEIVIERLMRHNTNVDAHLMIAPGAFADDLLAQESLPFTITRVHALKKLNRQSSGKWPTLVRAATNHIIVSWQAWQLIRLHQCSVVHANTRVPAMYLVPLAMISRLLGWRIKWCWSDHDMGFEIASDKLVPGILNGIYHRTLVVSKAVAGKYRAVHKIRVLYNGLDTRTFFPEAERGRRLRTELGIGAGDLVIGMAGVINPDKGQLAVIDVFRRLRQSRPGIRLLLAGRFAPEFPDYCEAIKQALSEPGIAYAGHLADMPALLNACDVVVNNSNSRRSESLGTTIYEAMACGRITLSAHTGGTPEIVSHGCDGFLFTVEDTADMERMLAEVLDAGHDFSDIRKQAVKKAATKFSIERMTDRYNYLLAELMTPWKR